MHGRDPLKLALFVHAQVFIHGRCHHAPLAIDQIGHGVLADATAANQFRQARQAHVHPHDAQQGFAVGLVDGLSQGEIELVFHRRAVNVGEHPFSRRGRELVPRALTGVVDRGLGLDQAGSVSRDADEVVGSPGIARTDLAHHKALGLALHPEKAPVCRADVEIGDVHRLLGEGIGHGFERGRVLEPTPRAFALGPGRIEGWHQCVDHRVGFSEVGQRTHVDAMRRLTHGVFRQGFNGLVAVDGQQVGRDEGGQQGSQHHGHHQGGAER